MHHVSYLILTWLSITEYNIFLFGKKSRLVAQFARILRFQKESSMFAAAMADTRPVFFFDIDNCVRPLVLKLAC